MVRHTQPHTPQIERTNNIKNIVYHAYKIAGGCTIALYNQENKKLYRMYKIKHCV